MKVIQTKNFNISNKTFRRDRNKYGGGLLFYINENIPCELINNEIIPSNIEMIMFEYLVKTFWLITIPKRKVFS